MAEQYRMKARIKEKMKQRNTTVMTWSLMHAGCRFDFANSDYR